MLGKTFPVISSFESLRQAQPLAGMWWRVTKELERGGLESTCLPLPGGSMVERGAGAPTFLREPIFSPRGLAVLVPYLPTREHAGSQSLFLNSERVLQATPTSLLGASSLCHPSLQPYSRATTLKVRAGAWLRDEPTLPLSFVRPSPSPARPVLWKSRGCTGPETSPPRFPAAAQVGGSSASLPQGSTHRCPPEARGCRAARRQSPGGGRWGLAPRCTGSHPL